MTFNVAHYLQTTAACDGLRLDAVFTFKTSAYFHFLKMHLTLHFAGTGNLEYIPVTPPTTEPLPLIFKDSTFASPKILLDPEIFNSNASTVPLIFPEPDIFINHDPRYNARKLDVSVF
jgi:hypothetical protein